MKKQNKSLFAVLLAIFFGLTVSGCSSNSDDNNTNVGAKNTNADVKVQPPSLDEQVANVKRDLPITDPSGQMTIQNIYKEGDNHVKMEIALNGVSKSDIDQRSLASNEAAIKQQMRNDACKSAGKDILASGVDFTIAAFDQNGNFIIETRVNQGDCS